MHFSSFRARLFLLVMLTSVLTSALVGGTLVVRNHFKLKEMAYSHLLAEADVVALQIGYALWANDLDSARRKLAGLAAVDEIGAVCIYDLEGRLFATYERASGEYPSLEPGFGLQPQDNWLVIANKPIDYEGTNVGTLEMAYDKQPINERLTQSVIGAVLFGAMATAAALLISLRVQESLSKPVSSLAASARYIAQSQDFSHRATVKSKDELGTLTDLFNSMLDEIERANAQRAELLARERAAREEAERATRIKDEFVATLSHELRTPLSAILGWTQMLRRPNVIPEGQRDQALQTIERNTRLQMQMVEDLLDMSRILTGKLRLEARPVSLESVIDAAIATVALAAEAKRIELIRSIQPNLPPVLGDSGRLQQVVWNFVTNAVKFTPAGGRVNIRLSKRDGQAAIEVSDTGMGIDPTFLSQVFDRFSQSSTRESGPCPHGGLGLGLAIVKQIVELHGGIVKAASEGLGRGATFTVELPFAPADGSEAPTDAGRLFSADS